uniref:Uncharacterized protein n=1 Tax=Sinocyclocheilus rhinocerous TaxID=307959 RepID=A0A673FQL1_9TELE
NTTYATFHQNLLPNNEANINKLINLKLTASYVYLSLVCLQTLAPHL